MAEQKKILVIDDDRKLLDLVKEYLSQYDMCVETALRADHGIELLNSFQPDLVILDVMMPDLDGFSACREIRKQSSVPIIMLTARGDVMDRVVGLEIGADDYMPKPFEPRELLARIQAILRRLAPPQSNKLRCGELFVDLQRKSAALAGADLHLTTTELEILSLFLSKPGVVLSRDTIMDHLRGIDCDAFNRSIDIAMSRLRKKLGDSAEQPKYFKTVWAKGYMFVHEVEYCEG